MSVGRIGEFDVKNGNWDRYVERLEMYFKINKIAAEEQVPMMITIMGDATYELLSDLLSPIKASSAAYSTIVLTLRNHLQPKVSEVAERYRFRQRRQVCGESVMDYITELKKLSRNCNFGAGLNENLRDQLICGLKSDVIRQRLFAEDNLDYARAVKLAGALEAAERDAAAVEMMGGGAAAEAAGTSAVHAITSSRPRATINRGTRQYAQQVQGRATRMENSMMQCEACGARNHEAQSCRFKTAICSKCGKPGHLRRMCPGWAERSGRGYGNYRGAREERKPFHHLDAVASGTEESGEESQTEMEEDFHQLCLSGYKPVRLPIFIDDVKVDMEVDTGSAISCISKSSYDRFFSDKPIEKYQLVLKLYDGSKIQPLGIIKPTVEYRGKRKQLELFVIEGGSTALLGRHWLSELEISMPSFEHLKVAGCNSNEVTSSCNNLNSLLDRHKELFNGGLGRFTGGKATLRVREGTVPVYCRARPLPYALRDRVDAELDAMIRDGVIEPVDCSDWATPLVPVSKADGGLRICADYKMTLNPALLVDRYPLPRFDDLLMTLDKSVIFSKCDLSQAYNQIELDESSKYTVVNTHRGLFKYNRLVYGLSSSSGIFQRTMSNLLKGIPCVGVFIDDVIIGGRNMTEHLQSLQEVFRRLSEGGLKLKKNKCEFLMPEIKYLGYIISKDGIRTDPDKVKAMLDMAQPKNVSELRSFLGLVNFYGKFIRNMSSMLAPLYELLKKNVIWAWTGECQNAFERIKHSLASSEVLAHYDTDKPLILTCDASGLGVGGVLTQPGEGGERPIAYVSRTLNVAEKNYAQIQREALAIVFSLKKIHQYLHGRRFLLRTDHKPLVSIFGPKTGIPSMAASRLQRWAVILSAYNYDIEYVNTKQNVADGLSRLPMLGEAKLNSDVIPEQTYLHQVQDAMLLDSQWIKRETARDPMLSIVVGYVDGGWPDEVEIQALKPYFNRRSELYLELGCLMWGHRVVVPEKCRDRVLIELHEPHMGIVKTKGIARSYVWWPDIDEAVEKACRACGVCAAESDAPRAHQPCPWPWPSRPWSRLHLDFLGPLFGKLYLVIVDATSKWIEVFQVPSTSASHTIGLLGQLFARFGLCKQIVSDNGPPFTSNEFRLFTRANGVEHTFSAPYHPSSNGAAENAVKTIKKVIKKAHLENQVIAIALNKYLLHYRNTEHSTTGDSPARILMGHSLRTKLDILRPDREKRITRLQRKQSEAAGGDCRQLRPGDTVWYRHYQAGNKWVPGEVSQRLGITDYSVRGVDGTSAHRNIDQLRQRSRRASLIGPPLSCEPAVVEVPLPSYSEDLVTGVEGGTLGGDSTLGTPAETPVVPDAAEPPVNLPQPLPEPKPVRSTRNKNPKYKF